jgi:hypothetical protein
MRKIKALVGLAVMVGLLATTASSALALFSSTNGKSTTGKGFAGTTTFKDEEATVTCAKAVGTWKLTKGARGSEVATAKGAENINLHVNSSTAKPAGWENCTTKIIIEVAAEVSECELQVKQTAVGQVKALGSVLKGCVVTVPGNCKINVPAVAANEGLKEIFNENKKPTAENLLSKVNVTGITSEAESLGGLGCVGIKPLKNAAGAEKGEVTGEGVIQE